jgi:hypothetical protein
VPAALEVELHAWIVIAEQGVTETMAFQALPRFRGVHVARVHTVGRV